MEDDYRSLPPAINPYSVEYNDPDMAQEIARQSMELRNNELMRQIANDIERGFVNIPYLIDKYVDDDDPTLSPTKIRALILRVLKIVQFRVQDQDLQFETMAYLTANSQMQETAYRIIDSYEDLAVAGDEKATKVLFDALKTLQKFKNDRFNFLDAVGALPKANKYTKPKDEPDETEFKPKELIEEGSQYLEEEGKKEEGKKERKESIEAIAKIMCEPETNE